MAEHVCPFWIGYLLLNPLRRWGQDPKKILGPYLRHGMTVLDFGPGMGFFSLPMAEMVSPKGKVICVDLQEKMLQALGKRAARAGLADRIVTHRCGTRSLGLEELKGKADFVLAYAVMHEVPDAGATFSELHATLKPGGRFLLAEPKGHVSEKAFRKTVEKAEAAGFKSVETLSISRSRAVLMQKPEVPDIPA